MSIRQMMLIGIGTMSALALWSSALSAQEAPDEGAAVSPSSAKYALESQREALERRREDYRDLRTGRYWRQPPWVTAREEAMEERRAAMREQMRQRQAAMEQWRDARGWWRNPRSQWIEEMGDARRAAMEARRLQSEKMIDEMMYDRPWPGGGRGGPWGGPHPYW
ncbi:MAG: hypothetical protein PVG98_15095 [Chromatiales bacterium]|jgi:hypothetical protein